MTYRGTVRNGVVELEDDAQLPDGTNVEVRTDNGEPQPAEAKAHPRKIFQIERFMVKTGIPDLSVNHDHYLYGLPKVEHGE